ncbi:TonB-dependent receptor [Sediminitomix flava]|uniref:Outer membrane receptor protein involved in Fe transport n=1 Tax=Sediminitomix flava TaxID=379075 RepID=A0A315ZBW9_SEDFL|nr:TonB-dependent receptor [Sediminitomix flava]PWJ43065.1 outer membrane receptor protein involved in Fe transport [Sediminitomix flava]
MKRFITLFLIFLTHNLFAQNASITGLVLEEGTGEAIIGASVVIKGTTIGASTDLEGRFTLQTSQSGQITIQISSVGMTKQEKTVSVNPAELSKIDLGEIYLKTDVIGLAEVEVLASVAIDRKTPVAVSTIKPELIEEKLGTQEFPEILKSTPGIYATKSGGGWGDARVNIRGFNSENVAVMINGVPVNDMENGRVYWSNWAGLSDVTRTMQVQRGLGAAKVAVPSIGGTINILTKTTDAEQGGKVFYGVGNNGYQKKAFTASTGLNENGWAMTVSGSHTTGDGYIDATAFEGWSYFVNISKRINMNHQLSFTAFGAPQEHDQRSTQQSISVFEDPNFGTRYNSDWGYKNGEEFSLRRNFYHKPQISLNHYWTVSDRTDISTSAYVSFAQGGGTGAFGSGSSKFYSDEYKINGQIDFDKIVQENIANGAKGSDAVIRASRNNHNWYGILSSLNTELASNLTITGGLDLRYYKGEHYREVVDLLGGQYVADDNDINNPTKLAKVGDIIDYNNDGEVSWLGLFGQAEYELDALSAFFAASVSQTGYRRTDYFRYEDSDPIQQSDWVQYLGYMAKGGANYNLTENHNVFMNLGYFEKAPIFDVAFSGFQNNAFVDAENEKIFSAELGYGFKSPYLNANVNVYRTHWMDKAQAERIQSQEIDEFVNITGVNAIHQGVELELTAKPVQKMNVTGMVSLGDWRWGNNIENREVILSNGESAGFVNIFREGTRVGNAAQTTAALGVSYELMKGFKVGFDYNYFGQNYADFDVAANLTSNPLSEAELAEKRAEGTAEAWQMPDVNLFDLSMSYKFKIGGLDAKLLGKVNNLFDTEYVADAQNGSGNDWQSARVYYGFGRTWSTSLSIRF